MNPCVNLPDTAVSLADTFAEVDYCHTANKRLIQLFKWKGKQLCYKATLEKTGLTHRFTFSLFFFFFAGRGTIFVFVGDGINSKSF